MDQLEEARKYFSQALEHHNRQRLNEAEALYRQALALAPERMSVLNNLATVLIGQSRFPEALALCERAESIEPGHPDTLTNAAICRRELSSPEQSLRLLDRAVETNPGDVEAHNNRGVVLQDLGRLEQALDSYDRALSLSSGHPGVLANRGSVLARLGRPDEAFACFNRALRIDPQFDRAGEGFIWLVTHFGYIPAHRDPDFDALVIRAISEPWARPLAVAPVLIALLRSDPVFSSSLQRVAGSWPARVSLVDAVPPEVSGAVFGNRLLTALLENAPVTDIQFEYWLGMLRHGLMELAAGHDDAGELGAHMLAFHCALARQCFINEYIHTSTEEELAHASRSREGVIAAMAADRPIPVHVLVATASYFPLSSLPAAERLLERPWPPAVDALLTQQVREPLLERRKRLAIPRLTGIEDDVSRQVRQQYEENPYPRWVSTPRVHRKQSLDAYLRSRVPGATWRSVGDGTGVEALNAGCGTGQNPIETAQRIAGIDMLAVDLSLASLCYAARMADRTGVNNIHFAQADILKLASIKRRFDLIESTGVLHHMHDPAQGLRILCSLLKDDGVMKLALYSEAARRAVVAARALIGARGYTANEQDIRRCRDELMRLDRDAPERQVTVFTDFYSLSECRDLLLHVQEHRFTIPRIQALLADAGLDFIGFELDANAAAGSGRSFADTPLPHNLGGWHEFETRHPDTFAGMYQFWAQKAATP